MLVRSLALEDDAFRHDNAGTASGCQVLGHIVNEQHFTALGLHRETVVRFDAALWRHERRISEDHVGVFIPSILAGEGVVLSNVRVRKATTKAESKMWNEVLSMRRFSEFKFLRQKPLVGYIVDFYCSALRLVIEIDGDSHAGMVEYDAERTKVINALGLTVIRYTNDEILSNIAGIYEDLITRVWGEGD